VDLYLHSLIRLDGIALKYRDNFPYLCKLGYRNAFKIVQKEDCLSHGRVCDWYKTFMGGTN
jgi:hypothetical protein